MPLMSNKSCSQHVAVLVFPFASHPSPLLLFVRMISAVAPDVKFSFFSLAKSNSSLFTKCNIKGFDNIKPYDVWDGLPESYVFSGNPLEPIDFFLKAAPGSFKKGFAEAEAEIGHKVGCLISDAFLWFACDMAEEMQIPWVPLWTSGQRPLFIHVANDVIKEKLGASGKKFYFTAEHFKAVCSYIYLIITHEHIIIHRNIFTVYILKKIEVQP